MKEVLDVLMLAWYAKYQENKEKIETYDQEFEKSPERKSMDSFIKGIVVVYENQNGRP